MLQSYDRLDIGSLAKQDYTQARALAQKLAWSGLVKEIDGFLSRLEIQRSLFHRQAELDKRVKQQGSFKPKKSGEVLVTEHFVSNDPELVARMLPIYEESVRYE